LPGWCNLGSQGRLEIRREDREGTIKSRRLQRIVVEKTLWNRSYNIFFEQEEL
jgi:hypothetical protein